MNLPPLTIRPFSPDRDIPRIVTLRLSAEQLDQEGIQVSEQILRSQLELPGHDPVHDRWVIEAPGDPSTLTAYAFIRLPPGSSLAEAGLLVHPRYRRTGMGTALLSRVIDRAGVLKAQAVQVYTSSSQPAGSAFLEKHCFNRLGAYTELRLTASGNLPPVIWPFGYTLRTYAEVQDIAVLTEAMNLCYIPLWGHHEASLEDMAGWLPDFNQQGLFLVFSEKGRVIGVSRVEPSVERSQLNAKPTGYIDAPGIVPQHRRLDLYRALVLTGIKWLRAQGQEWVEMESWGDKQEVLKMYRELGFTDLRQLVWYKFSLESVD